MDDFDPIDDEMRLEDISRNDDPDDVNYEQETDIAVKTIAKYEF